MRPQTLTMCGLGSYTDEETIDFTGKNFIAVVGDTGAGKSTILEAICYALYNRCTYAGTSTSLIADGGNGTMAVTFTFSVGNRRWQVARSASRHTPLSVHRLTCLDTGVLTTGARPVTAEIQRIIGLDYDTFLRAVVLPQGRFQELLRMNDRERGQVLDTVLGLHQLVQVRDHAKTLQLRLKDRLVAYQLHRRRFLDDPTASLASSTDQHHLHQQRLARLENARAAITGARADQQRAATAADALVTVTNTVREATPAGAAEQLRALAVQAHTLDGERNHINQLAAQLQVEQNSLRQQVTQAEQRGATVAGTATAISILGTLHEQIPQQRKRTQQLAERASAVAAEHVTLKEMKQKAEIFEPRVAVADQTYTDAEAALTQARQRRDKATETLKRWHEKTTELQTARTELAELDKSFRAAQGAAGAAKDLADQAERERDQCEHTHTLLLKANAVAEAAADLQPGAACITCSRPLPADFTPPAAPDLTAADTTRNKARTRAEKAGRQAAVATAHATTLKQESLPAAQQTVTTAEKAVSAALGKLQVVVAHADLWETDEQILNPFVNDTATAEDTLNRARQERDDTRKTATAATTAFDTLSRAHTTRVATQQEQEHHNLELQQAIDDAANRLPARFAVSQPLHLADIDHQKTAAEAHQQHLQQLTKRQTDADEALAELRERGTDLDKTYATTITRPAAKIRDKLMTLAQRVHDAAAAVGYDEPATAPDVHAGLEGHAQWAADLLIHAQTTVDVCTAHIAEHRQAERRAVDAIAEICQTVNAADDKDLEQQYLAAYGTVQNLQYQIDRAQAEIPVVRALQERIDAADGTVHALEQLHAALAGGKFIAEAVRRRVQALLYQASDILFTISGGHYRFAPDFRILDLDTTAERGVKTLSGGETFLASLALALAVVELASNASSHVEALFLDEGFGTLDTTHLRDALTVLTGHSTTGRLVTVISHMRSITENAEHVLVVEKTLTTSRVHWADAAEKEKIINDDLGRGLLD